MLVFAAALGLGLIWLPGWIVLQYERANALGSIWGTIYLGLVGTGLVLVLASGGWLLWRLWGRKVAKLRSTATTGQKPQPIVDRTDATRNRR